MADSQAFHGDEQHGTLASHSLQFGWLSVLATRSLGFQKCGCNSFLPNQYDENRQTGSKLY
jgi:hypothetical protein